MSTATAAKGRLVMLAVAAITSIPVVVYFAIMLVSGAHDTISGWLQ
ncbi:hypothetical protein [Branchiibius cervicis]|uniref:FERM domain-containing protein n=1 Tax=Branchiibius cervicis TaxID=908252 RepID=A0ABW2AR50_9MICO